MFAASVLSVVSATCVQIATATTRTGCVTAVTHAMTAASATAAATLTAGNAMRTASVVGASNAIAVAVASTVDHAIDSMASTTSSAPSVVTVGTAASAIKTF